MRAYLRNGTHFTDGTVVRRIGGGLRYKVNLLEYFSLFVFCLFLKTPCEKQGAIQKDQTIAASEFLSSHVVILIS